jgi:molybdenum cofactor cytidylyltransferase
MAHARIGVIVLAAGASSRMGRPKQLLPCRDGMSLVRRAAIEALRSGCRPVVVVTGAHARETHGEVRGLPVQIVENPSWAAGMGTSLRVGLAALEEVADTVDAAVVMLCDQPLATAAVLERLVEAQRASGAGIVASEYAGTLGVPAVFARAHFAELDGLNGAAGAKGIIAAHAAEVVRVPFPGGVVDVDTPEDYSRQRGVLGGRDASAHPV